MSIALRIFVWLIYLSLLYELVGIPVPSVASTYQLFNSSGQLSDKASLLTKVRGWHPAIKFLFLLLPTAVGVIIYLLPLIQSIWPPFSQWLHPVFSPDHWLLVLTGSLLAIVGRTIGLSAATIMHKQPETEPDFSLKTRGPFALTRNPILVGMHLTFVGLWLLFPSWEMGIGFILFAANMHFRVRLEEDFLIDRYGVKFETFIGKTKRYF